MRSRALFTGILLLLSSSGAHAESYNLTIHLSNGQSVTIPHDAIARIAFVDLASGVEGPDADGLAPRAFQVLRNYPNPFNPSTTIVYEIPAVADVTVRVFDLHGALVSELQRETRDAGRHEVTWNGTDGSGARVASGIYLCAVSYDGQVRSRQMILVK